MHCSIFTEDANIDPFVNCSWAWSQTIKAVIIEGIFFQQLSYFITTDEKWLLIISTNIIFSGHKLWFTSTKSLQMNISSSALRIFIARIRTHRDGSHKNISSSYRVFIITKKNNTAWWHLYSKQICFFYFWYKSARQQSVSEVYSFSKLSSIWCHSFEIN